MDRIDALLLLVPALPLCAAIVCAVLGPRLLRHYCHVPVVLCLIGACVASVLLFRAVPQARVPAAGEPLTSVPFERVVSVWRWAAIDDALPTPLSSGSSPRPAQFSVDVVLRVDALTAMMLTMVTFISSCIALYAAGYMRHDRGYWRFFAYLALFVFSMTMLVSVSNLVLLYVFWEAVGLCSYLLIGFWYEKPEAAAAGKKAFLVNRVGDFGFALALFLLWTTYGTLNFHDTTRTGRPLDAREVTAAAARDQAVGAPAEQVVQGVLSPSRITARNYVAGPVGLSICLLLMLGACGKSAQFPLHVWLPDAMEGPTPVSALIHAATMVTAGVYMVARCTPLFMVSPTAQLVVACVGGGTALLAALIALTQFDLKRVLAYSTISQLGYMFLGLGAGTFLGITSGLFHLFTHAFFKALLFLGAGSVMHAMGDIIDMRRFGGLRLRLPITHATFFIGCCALAGLPPFSGFWSKDAVVASIEERMHALGHAEAPAEHAVNSATAAQHPVVESAPAHAETIYRGLFWLAIFTGFLTALYTFRAFYLTFYGPERIPVEAGDHAHEAPPVMWWPLVVLSLGAAAAGFICDLTYTRQPVHLFAEFLASTPSLATGAAAATRGPYAFHASVAAISVVVAVAGVLLATYLYVGDAREVRWLKSLFDFEEFSRWYESGQRTNWHARPWVAAIDRAAERIGCRWLVRMAGQLLLLMGFVLASPLLLGNFFSPYKLSFHKFFLDELYDYVVVVPLQLAAIACNFLDRWVVDGAVNAVGKLVMALGSLMRSLQMGQLQFYALAMFLGVLVLLAAKLILIVG
jgi:NADH-quinone oxidoreductase subunit L